MDLCPICQARDLRPHCAPTKDVGQAHHPTCHWLRCHLCSAVLDPENARGFDRKLKPFRLRTG